MSLKSCPPGFSFTAFVLWLLAVPMDGPLSGATGLDSLITWFLPAHVASLFAVGSFCPEEILERSAPVAVLLTVLLTLLLPIFPGALPWIAIFLGVTGAIVAIRACSRLQLAQNPVFSAASGLIAANLLLFALMIRPGESVMSFFLVAIPLLCLLLPATPPERLFTFESARNLRHLWIFLPFIFLFHVVGGMMYSAVYPAYLDNPLLPGLELLFYVGSIAGSIHLITRRRELPLVGGILLAMLAFILLQHSHQLAVNLSMYCMQAGQGLVDLFLIVYLLTFRSTWRAFGFGLATLCLGIFSGHLMGQHLGSFIGDMTLYGLISLNLAALSLYLYRSLSQRDRLHEQKKDKRDDEEARPALVTHSQIPDKFRQLLSDRELMVLVQSLSGRTYRDIAAHLGISESSVKTYMKRVYDKLDIRSRKGLFDLITPDS